MNFPTQRLRPAWELPTHGQNVGGQIMVEMTEDACPLLNSELTAAIEVLRVLRAITPGHERDRFWLATMRDSDFQRRVFDD